ncbi:MAG TPA: trypsin-like peptidase domain-containing protein [Kofleriaceae bacterium]|jgi:Do/DeqQ family serine protease
MQSLRNTLFAAAAAFGFVGLGAAIHTGSSVAHAGPVAGIPTDGTIADVAEHTVDSVVNISTSHQERAEVSFDPFGMGGDDGAPHSSMAKGSGVIVTASGRILTNAHVVDGADDIKVTLQDGTELDAKVIGKDVHADLAVLQLQGKFPALKPITFGDSSALRLGDIVLAVGDGLGVGKSVSMGIVSAKGLTHVGIEDYEDFIQTDAAINPGNSGGALVNLKGELVGINTAIASRSGGSQGIGFAIPTNMARPIMETLVKDGKISRGYLGVNIATVTPALLKEHKLGAQSGVVVAGIEPNGPAARTGLADGDVIVALGGKPVKTDNELRYAIAAQKPGATVELDVVHQDGQRATVKAKLGELPERSRQQELEQQQQPQIRRYEWHTP